MKNSHLLKKIQDTRYKKHCTWDNYASVPFKVMTLRKSGSLVAIWIKSLATAAQCSCGSGSRSCGKNFPMTCFMPRPCVKISDAVVFGMPRSDSGSHTVSCQSWMIAACTHSTFSGVLLVAGLPECGSLSTDSQPSLKHLCHTFTCTAFIASSPKSFWIIQIISTQECLSLMQNLMQIPCSTQSFWMRWPHSTHAHSRASTAPTD